MNQPDFDKTITNSVKAVALILMFTLHFFCFPDWLVAGQVSGAPDAMAQYQGHFQICVAMFTFLSGYFFFFAAKKNGAYLLKKTLDLYVPYWCVFAVLLAAALITGTYDFSWKALLLEAVGVYRPVMNFCWYVTYYILMLCLLTVLAQLFRSANLLFLLAGLAVPMGLYYGASYLNIGGEVASTLEKLQVYFPIAAMGYWCAGNAAFEKLDRLLKIRTLRLALCVVLLVAVFFEPSWLYGIGPDNLVLSMVRKCVRIVSIPLFMYAVIRLLQCCGRWLLRPLAYIGKHSMLMWFLHCVFFNCSKEVFQPLLYFPRNPVLILLWGLAVTLVISIPLDHAYRWLRTCLRRKAPANPA